jgi:hypothetical protein
MTVMFELAALSLVPFFVQPKKGAKEKMQKKGNFDLKKSF